MKIFLTLFTLLSVFLFTCPVSHARIYIRIDEVAEKKFPIALTNLVNVGDKRDKYDWAREVPDILKWDLRLTGLFEFVEPDIFPKEDKGNVTINQVNFPAWKLLGIQGVVKGLFRYEDDGRVHVELYLYDPFLGERLVGQEYKAAPKDLRTVAHHFADKIVETLTGYPGIFQTRLAFISDASGNKEVYTMGIDGHGMSRLTSDRRINISPEWSPDGSRIVYTSFTDAKDAEVKMISPGTQNNRQVTHNKKINLSPTWLPNGQALTVAMGNGETNLYNISLNGKVLRRLTNFWGIDIAPTWAPDGSEFAFASERSGGLHIFRADADGGNIIRMTFVGYQNDNPAWSPDGEKIAFQGRDQGVWDLFIMNSDGSVIQRLTSSAGHNEFPTWAPNSQYIAFSSSRPGPYQIFVMTRQGENQIRVNAAGSCTQPDWGPLTSR